MTEVPHEGEILYARPSYPAPAAIGKGKRTRGKAEGGQLKAPNMQGETKAAKAAKAREHRQELEAVRGQPSAGVSRAGRRNGGYSAWERTTAGDTSSANEEDEAAVEKEMQENFEADDD